MLYELIANIVLRAIGLFVTKAEERAAWEKAIKSRLKELDASSGEASTLRDSYDDAMKRLKDRQSTPPK
jgi:hypothetical protein